MTFAELEHLYYDNGMHELIPLPALMNHEHTGYVLLVGAHAAAEALMRVIAQLAMDGAVNVLDAGNHFDVYRAARLARLQSKPVYEMLERIQLARVFNACQLTEALRSFRNQHCALVVMGGMVLFEDEAIGARRMRLFLQQYLAMLSDLAAARPVLMGVKPGSRLQQHPWRLVFERAAQVYEIDPPTVRADWQPGLFDAPTAQERPLNG